MINLIRALLIKLSKTRSILVLLALVILTNIVFQSSLPFTPKYIKQISENTKLLDSRFSYSVDTVEQSFANYGELGRNIYIKFQLLDLIYPIFYSLLLASLLFRLFTKSKFNPYLFAIFAGIFDYIENLFIFLMNISFPDISKILIYSGSFFTSLKWSFIIISVIIIIAGSINILIKKRTHS